MHTDLDRTYNAPELEIVGRRRVFVCAELLT